MPVCDSNSNSIVFVGNMINESCHLSSKVEIMVSICLIAPYKFAAGTQKISGFRGVVRLRECVACSNLINHK